MYGLKRAPHILGDKASATSSQYMKKFALYFFIGIYFLVGLVMLNDTIMGFLLFVCFVLSCFYLLNKTGYSALGFENFLQCRVVLT